MNKVLCNICQNPTLHTEKEIIYINGQIDKVIKDRCIVCGNLAYGNIKKIGTLKKVRGIKEID